jgi:hypothetical protein
MPIASNVNSIQFVKNDQRVLTIQGQIFAIYKESFVRGVLMFSNTLEQTYQRKPKELIKFSPQSLL